MTNPPKLKQKKKNQINQRKVNPLSKKKKKKSLLSSKKQTSRGLTLIHLANNKTPYNA
jgi:hypothetical protein